MNLLRNALLWGSQNKWLERQFRRRRFARKAVSRFMPGEELPTALDAAARLRTHSIASIITCLGENVESADAAEGVVDNYLGTLDRIHEQGLDTHVSVKLTHLGLDLDPGGVHQHIRTLATHAAQRDNFLWIDMEASSYVDTTLDLYRAARKEHRNVGLCLQAYLYRTKDDLDDLLCRDATIRLVKGAYREPPDIAFARKRDVDENYVALAEELLRHPSPISGVPHAMATHDLAIIDRIRRASRELAADHAFEIDMLYGIRQPAQIQLATAGVRVRVLISYGDAWFAWYMRRLAERPANVGFVLRSLVG